MATKKKATRRSAPAAKVRATKRFCAHRQGPERTFGPEVAGERLGLIRANAGKWVNGTVIRYTFFPNSGTFKPWFGSDSLKNQARAAFERWTNVGIGVSFQEVDDRANSDVRIGFWRGDGHWSYVGTDVRKQGVDDRTMNLDPDDGIQSGAYGIDVATHEIGHTLGFPHEHQNPNAGIVWNEEAVYAALGAPPNNWDRATTFHNIIRKIPADQVQGSTWDPNSIMHYPFEPGLIKAPPPYDKGLQPKGALSDRDKEWVKTFYPPLAKKDEKELALLSAERLSIGPGQQRNFLLRPKATRYYTISTFGTSDTVAVLNLRDDDGTERYLTADDDSGADRNVRIYRRLQAGYTYVLRLRLYYAMSAGETAVMWW